MNPATFLAILAIALAAIGLFILCLRVDRLEQQARDLQARLELNRFYWEFDHFAKNKHRAAISEEDWDKFEQDIHAAKTGATSPLTEPNPVCKD